MTESRDASMAEVRASADVLLLALAKAEVPDAADAVRNLLRSGGNHFQYLATEIDNMVQTHAISEASLISRIDDAFPGKDTRAHREAHEAWMAREVSRSKLRQAIIEKSLTALVWMLLLGLGTAVWHWVKASISTAAS